MEADAGIDNAGHDAGPHQSGPARDAGHTPPGPDLDRLAQDWVTLWQSEISAMAADPETCESWHAMMTIWAGAMSALAGAWPRPSHDPSQRSSQRSSHSASGSADAPRPAPAAAAPDPRDAEIERLSRHVAALERRMAELERNDNAVDPGRPAKPTRGRRSGQ